MLTPADGVRYYEHTLMWLRRVAVLNYYGGAYDPQRWGDLADAIADHLRGEPVADYDAAQKAAEAKAAEWTALFAESKVTEG